MVMLPFFLISDTPLLLTPYIANGYLPLVIIARMHCAIKYTVYIFSSNEYNASDVIDQSYVNLHLVFPTSDYDPPEL